MGAVAKAIVSDGEEAVLSRWQDRTNVRTLHLSTDEGKLAGSPQCAGPGLQLCRTASNDLVGSGAGDQLEVKRMSLVVSDLKAAVVGQLDSALQLGILLRPSVVEEAVRVQPEPPLLPVPPAGLGEAPSLLSGRGTFL